MIEIELRKLLESYTEPCVGDCDHSQCPLLRELHALQIKATLERARLKVKPIVDRERAGEDIGDLMQMRLDAPASTVAPQLSYYEQALTTKWEDTNARRHGLIEAKLVRPLSESEITELRELQWLAGLKRELGTGPMSVTVAHDERERFAKIAESLRPSGGRMWTDEQAACFEALTACAKAIRETDPSTTVAPQEQSDELAQWSSVDNWPLPDVLNKLADATECLLNDYNYDREGWEQLKYAALAARRHVALLTAPAALRDKTELPPSVKTGIDGIARHIAAPIRECATAEQYAEVIRRATDLQVAAAQTLTRATASPSTAANAAAKIADQLIPHLDHAFLLTKGWRDQIASIIERSLSSGS